MAKESSKSPKRVGLTEKNVVTVAEEAEEVRVTRNLVPSVMAAAKWKLCSYASDAVAVALSRVAVRWIVLFAKGKASYGANVVEDVALLTDPNNRCKQGKKARQSQLRTYAEEV